MDLGQSYAPLGFAQVTDLSAAVNLPGIGSSPALPVGAHLVALIEAQTQGIRWRDDGTDPTDTVGQLIAAGDTLQYSGNIAAFRAIQVTGTAAMNVSYYRAVG